MADYRKLENLVERYSNAVAGLDADVVERLSDALDASYRNLERELRKIYPEWESMGSLYAAQRRLLLMEQLKPVLAMVRPDQEAEYEALFTEAIRLSHTSGATLADELVNLVEPGYPLLEFSTIPIEAAALQARDGIQRLRKHDEEFRSQASAIVEQGLLQGWGAAKVAQQLASELGALKAKAETIGRTEVMSAFNDSAQQRYEENGLEVQVIVTPSEALCSICVARNGNVYPVGKVRVPFHPRCRCILLPWSKAWQELGLVDEQFMRDYRRDNLIKARAQGIEPDYRASYWERKAGQPTAPKPLWQPASRAEDAKAQPQREPKPKQPKPSDNSGPVVVRAGQPTAPGPLVPPDPTKLPAGHAVTLNPRIGPSSLDDALDAIATPGAAQRVQQFRTFVQKHDVQAVLHDTSQPKRPQLADVKKNLRYQGWAKGNDSVLAEYTQPMEDTLGYTHSAFDHVVVSVNGSRSGTFRVNGQLLNIWAEEIIDAEPSYFAVSSVPHQDTADFLAYVHEMGHQIHDKVGSPRYPDTSLLSATKYGLEDDNEWFAEHFSLWLLDAERYRLADPLGAKFVEDTLQQAIAAERRAR
ncbi:MAG TPA: minor capsid protein [Trichocoleus sp.]